MSEGQVERESHDLTFGPNFMSDDIPIFQKSGEGENVDWKQKLHDESVKIDSKVDAARAEKKSNATEQGLLRLISILASQAYIFLGAMENPTTGTRTPHLDQARETIDCLAALHLKTKGNLSEEEDKLLKQVVSELQMIYVDMVKGPVSGGPTGGPI